MSFFNNIINIFKNIIVIFILILLQRIGLFAQARNLTYEEAVNIALQKSYTIKSFKQNKLATQFYFDFYKAQFKPKIDINLALPSWNEMVESIQRPDGLPVYNSVGSMRFSGDLSFTFILPTGGNFSLSSTVYRDNLSTSIYDDYLSQKFGYNYYRSLKSDIGYSRLALTFNQPLLTANVLRENLKEAKYYYERTSKQFTRGQLDIVYEVTRGFYSLYKATRETEIAKEKLKNAQDAYRIAQIKAETGRLPEIDVLITKVDLAKSEANLSEQMNTLEREKDNFKRLIGLNLNEDVQVLTDLKYEKFNIDFEKAIQSALKNRLELIEKELDVKLQKIEVDRAKRYSEFKSNISAYYDFTGVSTIESNSTQMLLESSFDNFVERQPNRGVTLTLSYPIFDWGRGRAKVQEANAVLLNKEFDLENTRNEIIREVREIVRSVEEAKNRLNIFEQSQEIAERTYQISKIRFESGDINSQELALEQERFVASQLAYLDAYITYQLAVENLKRKALWDFQNNQSYLDEINVID